MCTPSNTWLKADNPNGVSIGSSVFAQLMAEHPDTLQWAALPLLKTAPSQRGLGPI